MNESVKNLLLGVAAIVAAVGFAVLLMRFGELQLFAGNRYEVTFATNNAGGLRPGSNIQLSGVHIGVVHTITYDPAESPYPVRITARIGTDHSIPTTVQPTIQRSLIGGNAALDLVPTPGQTSEDRVPGMLPRDGSAKVIFTYETLVEQVTSQLDQRMQQVVERLDTFAELSETYTALGKDLRDLLEPQQATDLEAGEQPNLNTAVVRLNSALDDARSALRLANEWLGDEQMRNDARTAVANAKTLINKASETVGRYATLADELQADADAVVARLDPMIEQLNVTLSEVRTLTRLARDGRGTMGQLLNNPDLYRSLNDAAIRLERTLYEAELLMQKVKSEGLPVDW